MRIRLVPELDKSPALLAFAQTLPGQGALLISFQLLLFVMGVPWHTEITLILFMVTIWPERRMLLIFVATTLWWLLGNSDLPWSTLARLLGHDGLGPLGTSVLNLSTAIVPLALGMCLGITYLLKYSAFASSIKRPVAVLLIFSTGWISLIDYYPLSENHRAFLWAVAIVYTKYIAYLAYTLQERSLPNQPNELLRLGQYYPFWLGAFGQYVGVSTPILKGFGYISRIEANTPETLAIAQLKGLKLALWAFWLALFYSLFSTLFMGQRVGHEMLVSFNQVDGGLVLSFFKQPLLMLFPLPEGLAANSYYNAFQVCAQGACLPWYQGWKSLLVYYCTVILAWTVYWHTAIAICRMAGFNAFRVVRRPFQSTTVIEFWNRIHYYYKELLVNLFFYPAYTRYFKNHPRLRMYFAIFAAAGLGNFLLHFIEPEEIMRLGPLGYLNQMSVYGFYAFALANLIFISHLRSIRKDKRPGSWFATHIRKPITVALTFMLLNIFGGDSSTARYFTLNDHFNFLFSLFGLGW